MGALPTRSELAERTLRLLHRGGGRNADVYLVRGDGGPLVVKDFARRGRLMRALLGPWLNAREIRAYRALEGHPAVPRFLGRIDALAFAVEYRPGQRMSRALIGTLPEGFLDELAEAVAQMHARGVAHLDLRHRSNLLMGEDGRPVLIDFASAVCLRPRGRPGRWLLALLARLDRRALRKWRRRLAAQPAGGSERPAGASGSARGASRPT